MRSAIDRSFARHSPDNRALLILTDVVAARLTHGKHALGTVLAHPGKHHANPLPAHLDSRRVEQHIHRGTMAIDWFATRQIALEPS